MTPEAALAKLRGFLVEEIARAERDCRVTDYPAGSTSHARFVGKRDAYQDCLNQLDALMHKETT